MHTNKLSGINSVSETQPMTRGQSGGQRNQQQNNFSYSVNKACLCPFSVTDENIRLDGAGAETVCVPANVCFRNVFASAARAGQMHSDVVLDAAVVLVQTKLEEITEETASRLAPSFAPEVNF